MISKRVLVRMEPEMHLKLISQAKEAGLSLNALIVEKLTESSVVKIHKKSENEVIAPRMVTGKETKEETQAILQPLLANRKDELIRCKKCGFMTSTWDGKRICQNKECRHEEKV